MKKVSTHRSSDTKEERLYVGLDLGDRFSRACVLDASGEIVSERRVRTTASGLRREFGPRPGLRLRVALEVGTHSPWASALLEELGCEVVVANARRFRAVYAADRKSDRADARLLARALRADPALLYPVEHRTEASRRALAVLRSREAAVQGRTRLINRARGLAKSFGARLGRSDADRFARLELPELLEEALRPLMEAIAALTRTIAAYDARIATLCAKLPAARRLREVPGVGPQTAVAFVLTVGDPRRFRRGRDVGAYLGLVPRRDQSGGRDPALGITKSGDRSLRCLLVNAAHRLMQRASPDCALRRWALALAERGGPGGKQRAAVATARKLAVLLLALWRSDEAFSPEGRPALLAAS